MPAHNDFLFELGCEELPPKSLQTFADCLLQSVSEQCQQAQLEFKEIKSFASPRRLALLITDLQSEQADQKIERRGPAVKAAYDAKGQPTKALLGFAKSCGVELSDLQTETTDKGEWLFYKGQKPGESVHTLMPAFIQTALKQLPIPKPMRWGANEVEFIRPVHWLVMLYGNNVIDCELFACASGQTSLGHRFHHPDAIQIDAPQHYENLLQEQGFVVASFSERPRNHQATSDAMCAATKITSCYGS